MTLSLKEKLEALSGALVEMLETLEEFGRNKTGLLPYSDELWQLNNDAEELQNSVYGLWSDVSELLENSPER